MGEWFAENKTTVIGMVVLVVAVYIFVCIKDAIGKKKGVDSEEKHRIQEIARRLIPDCAAYTVAYATNHEVKTAIGKTTTYYYYYAVAFKPGVLQIIPPVPERRGFYRQGERLRPAGAPGAGEALQQGLHRGPL